MDPTLFNPFEFGAPALGISPQPPMPLPEQMASLLASKNITPQQFLANPQASVPMQGGEQPGLGASLNPVEGGEASPAAPMGAPGILSSLAGLKAPAAPVPQRVGTPNPQVPAPKGAIKGGDLIALLSALSGQVPTTKVPMGLGGATGGR